MLTETTYNHVTCVTGDGRNGYAPLAPYDRIIAWATPNYLPNARKNQLKNDGILVTPFQVRPLANCIVTVRLKKKNGKLFGEQVSAEGYISMTDEPLVDFFGYEAQAEIVGEGKDPYWASSIWMKKHPHNEWTQTFLSAQPISPPYPDTGNDLRAFLLGTFPNGFTTAYHPEHGFWIGYSTPKGFDFASKSASKWLVSDFEHKNMLEDWWKKWKRLGKLSYSDLLPFVDGQMIKVKLKGGLK